MEEVIKRTSAAAFFFKKVRALVNMKFNLAARIPGEIAQ